MRILILVLVFASMLAAQRGRGGGGFRGSGGHGFQGGVVHRPGFVGAHHGGFAGGYNRGFAGGHHGGFIGGGFRSGFGGVHFGFGGRRASWYPYRSIITPWYGAGYFTYGGWYGAPFWSGYSPYYSGYPGYYGYPNGMASPYVTVVTTPTAVDTTPSTIVINSDYGRLYRRNERDDRRDERPQPENAEDRRSAESRPRSSPIYLIATSDGVISAAVAYSVENETLTFITLKGERRQIPLAKVDRSLTEQLNRERRVPFQLP